MPTSGPAGLLNYPLGRSPYPQTPTSHPNNRHPSPASFCSLAGVGVGGSHKAVFLIELFSKSKSFESSQPGCKHTSPAFCTVCVYFIFLIISGWQFKPAKMPDILASYLHHGASILGRVGCPFLSLFSLPTLRLQEILGLSEGILLQQRQPSPLEPLGFRMSMTSP